MSFIATLILLEFDNMKKMQKIGALGERNAGLHSSRCVKKHTQENVVFKKTKNT